MTIGTSDVPYPVTSITFDTGIAHETNWLLDEILEVWDVTDSVQPVEKITLDKLRAQFQTTLTETGTPLNWYYSKQVRADCSVADKDQRYINFYPTVGEDRDFIFRFTRKPKAHASGSVASLLIPDEWAHVVFEGVLMKAWRQRGDDRWLDARTNYLEGIEEMKAHYADVMVQGYNPAGTLVRSRFPQIVTQS